MRGERFGRREQWAGLCRSSRPRSQISELNAKFLNDMREMQEKEQRERQLRELKEREREMMKQ